MPSYLYTGITSVCRVRKPFGSTHLWCLLQTLFSYIWMYVKSMTCSFQRSGCFIISIPINNSTRDTATEAPLPYKVTETPISYNHSISVYIESFITINDILAQRHNFTYFEVIISCTWNFQAVEGAQYNILILSQMLYSEWLGLFLHPFQ